MVLLSASFTPAMAMLTIVAAVSPAAGAVNVGETLVVNVTVADVTALFGAEFHLTFDAGKPSGRCRSGDRRGADCPGSFLSNDFVAQNTAQAIPRGLSTSASRRCRPTAQ